MLSEIGGICGLAPREPRLFVRYDVATAPICSCSDEGGGDGRLRTVGHNSCVGFGGQSVRGNRLTSGYCDRHGHRG